jgi:uncharacterized membrane protein
MSYMSYMSYLSQTGVMLMLMPLVGMLLLRLTQKQRNQRIIRWTGYGLIITTVLLLGLEVVLYYDAQIHQRTH